MAVNTAFEKDRYPAMGDENRTKKHIKQKGWTMPMARDKDEACIRKVFGFGTPTAFILSASGVVLRHGVITQKHFQSFDETFEKAIAKLEEVDVPEPYDVHKDLKEAVSLIKDKKYADAFKKAKAVAEAAAKEAEKESEEEPEEFSLEYFSKDTEKKKRDAEYLCNLIRNSFKRKAALAEKSFNYDPKVGIKKGEAAAKTFAGLAGVDKFAKKVKAWPESEVVKDFKALEKKLKALTKNDEAVEAEKELSKDEAKKLIADLEEIVKEGKGNRIAVEAGERVKALRKKSGIKKPEPKVEEDF